MSTSPHNDTLLPGVLSGSAQTPTSRPPASARDPSASKRVCFYKSGDPQFSGHRLVINSRTFKTFDALLDALSKKVPLPFGVRTITTPRGTHAVRSLDDLRDGASYVCSDQRRVKPLNLEEVIRRQVPWNTTRLTTSGRQGRRGLVRQLAKKNEVSRTAKVNEGFVKVWTPKRLVVFKNRDPSIKRTVVLQRRTAPTFEALLDYLSQVLQFPVVKLYTADGIRVEGLPALILCSGIVVAAGNEPFRWANYNLQGSSQPSQSVIAESTGPAKTQALPGHKNEPAGSRPRSRMFSLSSERYFVNQINKSLNASLSEENRQKPGSMDTEINQPLESEEIETSNCVADTEEKGCFIMPSEEDIEKSFRVNQDGSMTVEMKVHLTIKQQEMIHWTTTLSRTCANNQQRAVCSQTGSRSPDNNNYSLRDANQDSCESKEGNTSTEKSAGLNDDVEEHCGSATFEVLEKPKPAFRRLPTPGPRRVKRKEATVENIRRVSHNEVQESTVGAYAYMERTAEGELTEGYCVVSRSSSSSTRPVPKPRKNSSGEPKHKKTQSSLRPSRMAEVLQLQNNGTEVTETVMHIYESQGTYENYFANTQVTGDKKFEAKTKETKKPDSTDSGPRSSSNDCDIDLTRQSTSSDSQNAKKNELLSLSSGQSSPSQKISNNQCHTNADNLSRPEASHKRLDDLRVCSKENPENKGTDNMKAKMTPKSVKSREGTSSDGTVSNKKQKGSIHSSLKNSLKSKSPETQSHTGSEKKSSAAVSSAESERGQKAKRKKKEKQAPNVNFSDQKQSSEKDLNLDHTPTHKSPVKVITCESDSCQNVNVCQSDTLKSPTKKKLLDVLSPPHSARFKTLAKPKSMHECRTKFPKENRDLSESVSMPALPSSPSNVHQYVENWLKKIQPESVPYIDEMDPHEAETTPKAEFWIGSGSAESSEIRREPEKEGTRKECASLEDPTPGTLVPHPPVQIRCEGEPVETQRIKGFCKSMPSVRIHPAEQESCIRVNKSSEALVSTQPADGEGEISDNTNMSTRSGMKPVLQQLCQSIQSIRRTSSHSHLASLEKSKSSSLPDFSSQVASVFGSPSKAFLSFLSVMTLKDGISNTGKDDSLSNSGRYPEALQVMQSLEKISNIEDEEQLKASLTSLQSATSSQLKKSWRNFQERSDLEASPPLSPRQSEQGFALEVASEGEEQDGEHHFGLKELMDELSMSEDLRKEISYLVEREIPGHSTEAADIASEDEDATTKDDFLEEEEGYSEKRASPDDNITRDKEGVPKASKSESCSSALDIAGNVQNAKTETCHMDLDTRDKVQTIEDEYSKKETCHIESDATDHLPNSTEEKKEDDVVCRQFKSECIEAIVHTHLSEMQHQYRENDNRDDSKMDLDEGNECMEQPETSEAENDRLIIEEKLELDENQDTEQSNSFTEEDHFSHNKVNKLDLKKDAEFQQVSSLVKCESNNSHDCYAGNKKALESPSQKLDHNIPAEEEGKLIELEDVKSEGLEHGADDENAKDGVVEQQDNINEDTESRLSECGDPDNDLHHLPLSDQESEQSDKTKGSSKSRESEGENELQTLKEEDIIEEQISSSNDIDKEANEHKNEESNASESVKDFYAEPESTFTTMSNQDGQQSDQDKTQSCKSQESVAELSDLEGHVDDDEDKKETHENEQSLSESNKEFDAEPKRNDPTMSDQEKELYDKNKSRSYKSQESEADHEFQMSEEGSEKQCSFDRGKDEEDEPEDKQSNALHSDQDTDENYPGMSDHNGSAKDNTIIPNRTESEAESEAEYELQMTDEENVIEENDEQVDENDDGHSDALDSDKNFGTEVKHELQSLGENITEENDGKVDTQSNTSDLDKDFDSESDVNSPAMSDQDGKQSAKIEIQSSESQESEAEHELQINDEESVLEEDDEDESEDGHCSAIDSDKEFDPESDVNSPAMSDQDGKQSAKIEIQSSESQESEAEHELWTKDEESVLEEDDEDDENEDGHCSAIDSEKDFETEGEHELGENVNEENDGMVDKLRDAFDSDNDFDPESDVNSPAMSDQDAKESAKIKTQSSDSQDSEAEHELQINDEETVLEENDEVDENEDVHCNAKDSDRDFGTEPEVNSPTPSDQDNTLTCKFQESKAKHLLRRKDNRDVTEETDEDEREDEQSNALDSDQDLGAEQVGSCQSQEDEGETGPELDYSAVPDQDCQLSEQDKTPSCKSQESGYELEAQIEELENITQTQNSSGEVKDDHANEHIDTQNNAFDCTQSYIPDTEAKHTLRKETGKSQSHTGQSEYPEGVEEDYMGHGHDCVHPMEISQDLLDFVNFALFSSALTFTCDSNGRLRIEPDRCKIREVTREDNQYVQRCLPSPNTSDLSDYRSDTSDSGGDLSRASTDLFTETGEEEVGGLCIYQSSMKPSFKSIKKCDKTLGNDPVKTSSETHTKRIASPSFKSINSFVFFPDSMTNGTTQDPMHSNTSSSLNEDSEPVQRAAFHSERDNSEGILIDKGRWLLKENHLIRKSPPVPMGMYENADTTSADTGLDNTSDDAPYPRCGSQHSPLAVISSSELEEMAKPSTPKCTYFNMPHSSDSDPFLDNQSISHSIGSEIRKSRELKVSPMGETSKTWTKKNGSLPSFASVEFKLPDGKIHPEGGLASDAVEKAARSQSISSRVTQEEESVEGLNLRCGRHCPIL